MSFADGGLTGSASDKTAVTSFFFNTTQVINVGDVHAVWVIWDNQDTATGDTTRITVTDTVGNTYQRVRERTYSAGVIDDGGTGALFVCDVATQIPNNSAITISFNVAKTAKAASGYRFTKAAGSTLAIQAQTALEQASGQPPAISLSGMPSREYLFLHLCGIQSGTTGITYTQQANYTSINANGTTGGSANTNQSIRGGFRVLTGTGDTVDITLGSGAALVQIFAAVYEVTGGGSALTLDLSDTVTPADTFAAAQDYELDLSDIVTLGESIIIAGDLVGSMQDVVPLVDDLQFASDLGLNLSDSVGVFDGSTFDLDTPCMPDAVCGTHLCGEAICGAWWACPRSAGLYLGGNVPDEIIIGQPPVPPAGLSVGTTVPGLVIEGTLTPPPAGLFLGTGLPTVTITTRITPAAAGLLLGGYAPDKVAQQYLTPVVCTDLELDTAPESSLVLVGAVSSTIALDPEECL